MKKNEGFTLVELIVVLIILAILAAIFVPALLGYIDNAKKKNVEVEAKTFMEAFQSAFAEEYGINANTGAATYTYSTTGSYIGSTNTKDLSSYQYYSYTNYFLIKADDSNWTSDPSSKRIAQQMEKYISDMKLIPYGNVKSESTNDYTGQSANTAASKIGNKYALFIVISKTGIITEFDFMHNGYLFIYKDGATNIYNSQDTSHGFVSKKSTEWTNSGDTIKHGELKTFS